jgi:hypothetical protein
MRTDSLALASRNGAPYKQPFIVVELSFDDANTDLLYLTSHAEAATPNGANVISNVVQDVSGSSQRLDIKNFNTTIGSMKFSVVDKDGAFSSYLRTKLGSDLSITKKRVRFYLGYEGVEFNEYALIQTQIVEKGEVQDKLYTIKCFDVLRQARKEIFERKETTLTLNLDSDDVSMTVLNTDGFETYFHGSSYSTNPNSTVGHLLLVDGDRFERVTYTSKTGNTFDGLERGAFGTEPIDFIAVEAGKSRKVKVYEYIYLEMPAVKLAYAIFTGSLYGDAQTLPAHWHLGIDPQYVATAQFTTIGSDWWDTTDDTKGRQVRFEGLTKENGKTFLETEVFGLLGCFPPILSTGEMGLSRLSAIVSSANHVAVLDRTNIAKASKAVYSHDQVVNLVRIRWAYDNQEDQYRGNDYFVDPLSVQRHKVSDLKTLKFKGLHSAKHSIDHVRTMFDGYRDRFAGPPISLTLTLHPSLNTLEVGDVVRVDLTNYPDYFGDDALDRAFEVQQVTVEWDSGKVQVKLAGSTQRAAPLVAYQGDAVIPSATAVPDAMYTNVGTNIETAYAAQTSRNGSIVTLDSDITFSGQSTLNDSAVLYVDGDFTIPFGVTLNIDDNVFLKVKGFFNCFGTVNGAGRGPIGEDYRRYMNPISYSPGDHDYDPLQTVWNRRIDNAYPETLTADNFLLWSTSASAIALFLRGGSGFFAPTNLGKNIDNDGRGKPFVIPFVDINPLTLEGLPDKLWGRGGKAGGPSYSYDGFDPDESGTYLPKGQGGNGGNGSAGLVVLARGMGFGASGQINLSGDDGGEAPYYDQFTFDIKGADGAPGHSGLLYLLMDGANSSPPDVNATTVLCNNGSAPDLGGVWPNHEVGIDPNGVYTIFGKFGYIVGRNFGDNAVVNRPRLTHDYPYPLRPQTDGWLSHALVQFLIAPTDPEEEPDEITDRPTDIDFTEYLNTPQSSEPGRVYSTIDIEVTPPSATNYSHSIIQARKSGTVGWLDVGPAQHEVSYTVDADGSTWEFRALGVSTTGNALETGPIESYQVANFSGNEAAIRPPSNVTGLRIAGKSAGQNTFDTPDLQVTWALNNVLGTGYIDSWVSHFLVELRESDGTLIHSETTKSNLYQLTLSDNIALNNGPYGAIQIRVYQVTVDGVQSNTPAQITFTNSAPAVPTGVATHKVPYGVRMDWTLPAGNDLAAVEVYMHTDNGFTAQESNKVFDGLSNRAQISNLSPNTTYYYRLRSRDVFGNLSALTAQYTVQTPPVEWGDLTSVPADLWEGGNLIAPTQHWPISTGGTNVTLYNYIGGASENDRVIDDGPFGNPEIVWRCIPDNSDGADGGWNTEVFQVDRNKTYVFGVYIKKEDDGSDDGYAYLGCYGSNTLNLDDSVNSNPYWISNSLTGIADPTKWYLLIGVLHHGSYTGGATGLSGVYDVETGEKVFSGNEFKIGASNTQLHRAYHYYNTTGDGSTIKQRMARPFVVDAANFPGVEALTAKLSGVAANATRNLFFNQTTQPTAENEGDSWYNDNTKTLQRWNGSGWEFVANFQDTDAADSTDLIYNSSHSLISPDGTPAGIIGYSASGGSPDADIVQFLDVANGHVELVHSSLVTVGLLYRAFKLDSGTKYRITFEAKASEAASNFRAYVWERNANLDDGSRHVLYGSPYTVETGYSVSTQTSFRTLASSMALTTSWQTFEYEYDPSSGAKWGSFSIRKTGGAANLALHLKNVTCVPIVNSDADNTQDGIDQGQLTGFDYYGSGDIFMRIHPRMMGLYTYYATTNHNTVGATDYGANFGRVEVDTEFASNRDRCGMGYQEWGNARMDDWNPFIDRKFRVVIDVTSNAGNINDNLLMSFTSMGEYYYTATSTIRATGFGFYTDGDGQLWGYGQTSSTNTATPTQLDLGINLTDQTGSGGLILEAIYDHSAEEITFTVEGVVGGPITQTLSLPNNLYDHGARDTAFMAQAQYINRETDNAAWHHGFVLGTCLFHQS